MFYPCYFPETAEKYLNIFNELQISDLIGQPKIKDIEEDLWYKEFAKTFFGSIDIEKRERLIQEFFVLIPKKNAKSTISGLILLATLIANPYYGAEFALIASSKEVVNNCFIPICECVKLNPALSSILKVSDAGEMKSIKHNKTNAVLRILTPLMKTNQGKKWQGVIIDELSLWQDIKNSVSVLNEIKGNLVNKKDAFLIYLTTQSYEPPRGVFKALLQKARLIATKGEEEILKNKFLPILYEFSEKEIADNSFRLPENWAKVNPNIGVSVDLERLKNMQKDAEQAGEQALREFYAKYLNVEISINNNELNRWAGADFWEQCEKSISLQTVIDKSNVLYIGIDGGGLDDLTGLSVLGIDDDENFLIYSKSYGYKSVLNRAGLAQKLSDFEKQGEVKIVEILGDDAKLLADDVAEIFSSRKVQKIGIDPRGVVDILSSIYKKGIDKSYIEFINQGTALHSARLSLERRLMTKKCAISRSDLMRFCANNAVIENRGDAEFLSKKSSQCKIDPLVALLNCVALFERFGGEYRPNLGQFDGNDGLRNAINFINFLKR